MKLCTASLFFQLSAYQWITWHNICQEYAKWTFQTITARDLARLAGDFANINIGNRNVTHSKVRRESQMPDKTEGSLLLPLQIRDDTGDSEGTIPCATASPNLYSPNLDSSQYITPSDAYQHSTRMRGYFHYKCNHFMNPFNDAVPDGELINAGECSILVWWTGRHIHRVLQ